MGWRFILAMPIMAAASWYICSGLIGKRVAEIEYQEVDCIRYIDKALPAIVSGWNVEEWQARSSGELKSAVKLPRVRRDFNYFRRALGDLRVIEPPVGNVTIDRSGGMEETVGYYSSYARFRNGNAYIRTRLVKRAGGWKFQQFKVRSDALQELD